MNPTTKKESERKGRIEELRLKLTEELKKGREVNVKTLENLYCYK